VLSVSSLDFHHPNTGSEFRSSTTWPLTLPILGLLTVHIGGSNPIKLRTTHETDAQVDVVQRGGNTSNSRASSTVGISFFNDIRLAIRALQRLCICWNDCSSTFRVNFAASSRFLFISSHEPGDDSDDRVETCQQLSKVYM